MPVITRKRALDSRRSHNPAAPLLVAGLLHLAVPHVRAADPQPYVVTIEATGEALLDEALNDSSTLISLREDAPVGPFALIARAKQDMTRFLTALRSFGYYKGNTEIRIGGRRLEDERLLNRLERMPADPPVPVLVRIDRGPLFRLGRIRMDGAVPDEVRASLGLTPGAPAVAANVLDARDRLLQALKDRGNAMARVEEPAGILREENNTVDITFKVEAGPRVVLGPIRVKGAESVNEAFIRRRLSVAPGDRYDPSRIEQSREDLVSLGVFSSVRARPAEELDDDGNLPIEFDLSERQQRVMSINAAFSTDIGGSVALSWRHRNLFGSAEQLTLAGAITQLGGNSTIGVGYNVNASLLKPDFLSRDQSLQANLAAFKQNLISYDQTAYTAGLLVNRRLSDYWKASVGLAAEQEQIRQQGVTQDFTLLSLPATLKYDDTDSVLEPTHGIRASASIIPTQVLAGPRARPFVLNQVLGSTYLDFGSEGLSVLALRGLIGYAAGSSGSGLPPDKRFYAGGSATVRGYRFQTVGPRFPDGTPQGGTAVAAGTIEFRQRFLQDYGAVLFVDVGQVTPNGPPFAGDWGVGTGIGARYYTSLGPIRFDAAVPVNRKVGSGSFELYIGLGQAF